MATTRPIAGMRLGKDAELPEVIEAVNELSRTLAGRLAISPSAPLDAPHPSASIVYSDDEYDALTERLEAPPAPSERLRRTMSGPTSGR
ncbi:MAG: DUF1778 domain-containing protein [Actinobacteria bacterium]|nr:DUF1778 domain-containing protein [Actinomycetota bacterium]